MNEVVFYASVKTFLLGALQAFFGWDLGHFDIFYQIEVKAWCQELNHCQVSHKVWIASRVPYH